ncbi:MAG: thioredoxin [Oscillospiraceae bacterium]
MSVVHFDGKSFETQIKNGTGKALVDFWAPWCGPCRMLSPIIDELAEIADGKVLIGKVNCDENQELASSYNVMTIPTMILFENGKETDRIIGLRSKDDLVKLLGL